MMIPDAERAAAFVRLLHTFQSVERVAHTGDLSRRENDVEHSYFLAMLCWYLCDTLRLEYSKEKVLQYALAHDLHEAYAGDTYIFDQEGLKTKKDREKNARVRIAGEFPEFTDLHETIETYEKRSDPEARFVNAVDKFIPMIINYIQGGHTWKEFSIEHDALVAHKRDKIGDQKDVRELLEQLIVLIGRDRSKYFSACSPLIVLLERKT
ncbi:MAG: HD domain-containing protein [bacterium]|nr:HD domain-containing protein [bacterium]